MQVSYNSSESYADMKELDNAVRQNGDVLSIPCWVLRDAYGASRLGSRVRENIKNELKSLGLTTIPHDLPDQQYEVVRLYRQGTAVAKLIEAAIEPGTAQDDRLREAAESSASETLERIRELVCT